MICTKGPGPAQGAFGRVGPPIPSCTPAAPGTALPPPIENRLKMNDAVVRGFCLFICWFALVLKLFFIFYFLPFCSFLDASSFSSPIFTVVPGNRLSPLAWPPTAHLGHARDGGGLSIPTLEEFRTQSYGSDQLDNPTHHRSRGSVFGTDFLTSCYLVSQVRSG